MDDMRLKYYTPVTTGTPRISEQVTVADRAGRKEEPAGESFQDVLKRQLQAGSGVNFSAHAVKRAMQNELDLSDDNLSRLGEGVKLAEEKNLDDTLILVGRNAFLVNVPNRTVITAVNSADMKGNVFTNIDGTVIV